MPEVGLYDALVQPVLNNAPVVLASAGLWFSLQAIIDYGVPAAFPKWHAEIVAASKKEDWQSLRSRVIGTIFSVYASVVAGYFLLYDPPSVDDFYKPHAGVHTWIVGVAVGYFIWDVVLCLRESWGLDYLAHGVAVLSVYAAALYPVFHHMACICLLFEASTPFLHARKAMLTFGWAKTRPMAFNAASLAFVVVFFLSRILVGLWASAVWWGNMLHRLQSGEHHSLAIMLLFLGANILLCGLNVMWFIQMIQAAMNASKRAALEKHK